MQKTEEKGIKRQWIGNKKMISGITLVALVVTIVVLLILAGITIMYVMGDNSIFSKASEARLQTEKLNAKEQLEIVLEQAKIFKYTDEKYNQNEYLDEFIKSKIQGVDIQGDIVIIEKYAYEIDRSIPAIIRNLGEASNLTFPTVEVTSNLADDEKSAIITIKAKEEKNGINRIEIWQSGEKVDEIPCNNEKIEITKEYIAKQNGKYMIKVYADLWTSKITEVNGIKSSVTYEPNGNNEWKKEHSTTVTIQETENKVIKAKYQWTNSVIEPGDGEFPENQIFRSENRIEKNGLTGIYYLWTMLETQSGENLKWRSEGFNFDNQGPNITTFTSTAVSYSSFKLNITAIDQQSGIAEYEFFVGGVSKGKKTVDGIKTSNTQEITINNATYGNSNCYVIVKDKLGNTTRKDIVAKTLMDTTGPTISSFTTTKYSETGITLSATARDTGTGITKFEFYIDGVKKDTQTCTATTSSVTKSKTITGISTGNHTCKVIVYDAKNNSSTSSKSGTTKLYAWEKWNWTSNNRYREVKTERTPK